MTIDFEIMDTEGRIRQEGTVPGGIQRSPEPMLTLVLHGNVSELQPGETLTLHFNKEGQ